MATATMLVKSRFHAEALPIPDGAWTRRGARELVVVVTAFDGRVERLAPMKQGPTQRNPTDRLTFAGAKGLPALIAKVEHDEAVAEIPAGSTAREVSRYGKRVYYAIRDGAYVAGRRGKGGAKELMVGFYTGNTRAHVSLSDRVLTRKGALELAALVAEVERA